MYCMPTLIIVVMWWCGGLAKGSYQHGPLFSSGFGLVIAVGCKRCWLESFNTRIFDTPKRTKFSKEIFVSIIQGFLIQAVATQACHSEVEDLTQLGVFSPLAID